MSSIMYKPSFTLLPSFFRGNWNLLWVIQRYLKTSISGTAPRKMLNVLRAFAEMKIGKTHVKSKPCVLRLEPTNICNIHCPRCSCGINTDPREKGSLDVIIVGLARE